MNASPDPLENQVHQALRDLPLRRAPLSLESRVLAEIARREALPWWRRSIAYWPAPARWIFIIISAALFGLAIATGTALIHGGAQEALTLARGPVTHVLAWVQVAHGISTATRSLVNTIPRAWFYGAIAAFVFAYAGAFAVGASMYRLVWKTN